MAMMISKFHKIIQSKVVWTAFALLISVAFVGVYTGAKTSNSQQRAQQQTEVAGRLFGEKITRQELGRAYRSVYVIYSLSMGRPINVTEEVDRIINKAAWVRLATLKKAEQLGLSASKEQVIAAIRNLPVFANQQTGQFDKKMYDAVINGFLPRTGMSAKGFEQLMTENVLIEKASSAATQGALVTDAEIKQAFHYVKDMLTVNYVSLPRTLAGNPEPTEEDAKAYFEQHADEFRMPEKRMVNYVQFNVADYTAQAEVTDEMISQFYEQNKQRYVKTDPAAAEDAEPEYQPLEEVRESIAKEVEERLARQAAAEAADAFAAQLADEETKFAAAAEAAGIKVVSTPAFTQGDVVKGIDPYAPFARAAFGLQQDLIHYYSDPVVGRDAVYVIELTKIYPSFPRRFEDAKPEALEAARIVVADKAYAEKAQAIHGEIQAALAAGTSFADAVAPYSLEQQTTAPFNMSTQLEDEFGPQIMRATIDLEAGELAELIETAGDFIVAAVDTRDVGDEAADLPGLRESLTASISSEKAQQMAAAWQQSLLVEAGFEDLSEPAETDGES